MGRLVVCLVDVWHLHRKRQANSTEEIPSPGNVTSKMILLAFKNIESMETCQNNLKMCVLRLIKQNSPCDPCMVHCCLHFCAVCQEHREMKNRLSDNFVMPMTVVNPPPVQEMSASNDSVPVSHHGSELEMRPL